MVFSILPHLDIRCISAVKLHCTKNNNNNCLHVTCFDVRKFIEAKNF